jgi:A/G-specific adenine glycosylase
VLALWSGLGYYARARNLHAAAKRCMELHDGDLPRDLDALIALPGIGRSTAGAILSQAWGDAVPILDGNVKRVLCRLFGIDGWPGLPGGKAAVDHRRNAACPMPGWPTTPRRRWISAPPCARASDPACAICPVQEACAALREGRVGELPSPKPGKPLPERVAHMLLIEDDARRVLLHRRPPTGVWAALWSLPEHADLASSARLVRRHMRMAISTPRRRAIPSPTVSATTGCTSTRIASRACGRARGRR